MHRTYSKVVILNVNETARPDGLDCSASGLAPWAWPREISYRQLNLLFTFTHLFVAMPNRMETDFVQTNKQTNEMLALHQ